MKTFIRRQGNKTRHLKHIIPLIPEFSGTYYEPFLGTGAVYLNILPDKAVLNDINSDIINIWKLVKNKPSYIINEITSFKKKILILDNSEKLSLFKRIISKMDTYIGDKRTINYLLMMCCSFSGNIILNNRWYIGGLNFDLYKNNKCHIFTQSYTKKLLYLNDVLKKSTIENKDYKSIFKETEKGDFVFIDPPYIEQRTYAFDYNKYEIFRPEELKKEVQKLDKKQVKWMMTQIDTVQIRTLFKGYNFNEYSSKTTFNGKSNVKKELIITNY
jgi:DNA adenine methylase